MTPRRLSKKQAKRPRARSAGGAPAGEAPVRALQYKVVELSTVDEASLTHALNEWVPQGWTLDGVQFAMRESSKRPAMAFVFFTRASSITEHDRAAAQARLHALAHGDAGVARSTPRRQVSAHERLAQLAGLDEPEPRLEGRLLEVDE